MTPKNFIRPRLRTGRRKEARRLSRAEIDALASVYASKYVDKDYEEIAGALGTLEARVKQQSKNFEAAARWFILDRRTPKRVKPNELLKQLQQIRDAADRLLAHLGIGNLEDSSDGPGDPDIYNALAAATEYGNEDIVAKSSLKITMLMEIVSAICATLELREQAHQGADVVRQLTKLTVPKGYQGDRALNEWTLSMLAIHEHLTGVNARLPLRRGHGTKLYQFLAAAARPLGVTLSRGEWKERVKTVIRPCTAE